MCNKYKFIADIDNKSVADFMEYGNRLRRVYLIFGIIALINIITTFTKEDHIIRILQVLGILLYAGIITCLQMIQNKQALTERASALQIWTAVKQLFFFTDFCFVALYTQRCCGGHMWPELLWF